MNRPDGRTSRRHFVDDGKVEVAIERHRKRARNRSRRHNERVWILSLGHELQPLYHTKSMLLVDDHQAQFVEHRMFFNESVCSNDHLNLTHRDLFLQFLPFGFLDAAPHHAYTITQRAKNPFSVDVMLFSKDLGRRHKCRLISVFNRDDDRLECNNGLAASNITLHQAIHRIGRLQVIHNLLQDALLRHRRMERQNCLHPLANAVGSLEPHSFQRAALDPAQRINQLEEKEFFENETPVVRRLTLVQL